MCCPFLVYNACVRLLKLANISCPVNRKVVKNINAMVYSSILNQCICRVFYFQIQHIQIYDQKDQYSVWWAFERISIFVYHSKETDVYIFTNHIGTQYHSGSVKRYVPQGISYFNDNLLLYLYLLKSIVRKTTTTKTVTIIILTITTTINIALKLKHDKLPILLKYILSQIKLSHIFSVSV